MQPYLSYYELKDHVNTFGGELQFLQRTSSVNLVAGGGYFNIDWDVTETNLDLSGTFDNTITSSIADQSFANGYLYAYLNLLKNVTFTIGVSYDYINSDESDAYDKRQFNREIRHHLESKP